ncbi:MAG: UvrD-helicase domain-containing protein, partial [Elusimicrobia bacterium]|nr:UvrD-helicase domain-containing protein [Elusimicrobiota bacterium]
MNLVADGDLADRRRAGLCLDRNVVVEAGAGTGKTTLLTDRALFLVLGAGVPITKVVALTFTQKAACEIRARLGDRLYEVVEDANAPDATGRRVSLLEELRLEFKVDAPLAVERARRALEDLDKAMIGTLHSFAAWILRSYPLEAGVAPDFQVDEGERFEDLFAVEWAKWLDGELSEHSLRRDLWLQVLQVVPLAELEDLAEELCGARVDLDLLEEAPAEASAWLRETVELLEAEPRKQPPARGNILAQIEEVRRRLGALLVEPADQSFPGPLPAASWPKGWSTENRDRYRMALRVARRSSREGGCLIRACVHLLRPFVLDFRRSYAYRGFISFDGLLVQARRLVRDHARVREELKKGIRAFLVDEFQDTDPLQGELVFYLSEKPGAAARDWEKTLLEPGKLFIVGDPKQSIYRFRGADLAAYERFTRHLLQASGQALRCRLERNFRSRPEILSAVNAVFGRLMEYRSDCQPPYSPIEPAAGSAGSQSPAVEWIQLEGSAGPDSEDLSAEALKRAEAEWIASWIERHCSRPRRPMSPGTGREENDCARLKTHRFKDIAILMRTTTPLEEYLDVFKRRGVPYIVEAEKYFYATQEVQDFLNLLVALDDPENRRALAGLLRSPLAGVSDATLYRLSVSNALDYRVAPPAKAGGGDCAELDRVARFYRSLRALRPQVGRVALAELIERMMETTRILEILPAAYHGQQTLSNLLKFRRMAAEAADRRGMSLREFIRRVSRAISDFREEGESPLADEHLDAVRILTIHKSKGLEFPVVIVANLSGRVQGSGRDRFLSFDWGSSAAGVHLKNVSGVTASYLELREKQREEYERVRLFYVACTRAKERLILLGSGRGGVGTFSDLLNQATADGPEAMGIAVRSLKAEATTRGARGDAGLPARDDPVELSELSRIWENRDALRRRLAGQDRFLRPSAFKDAVPWEPEEPRGTERPQVPGGRYQTHDSATALDENGDAWIGRMCHKVLERWDFQKPGDLDGAVEAARASFAWEFPGGLAGPVLAGTRRILKSFLGSQAARELAHARILGREMPFTYGLDGQIVHG